MSASTIPQDIIEGLMEDSLFRETNEGICTECHEMQGCVEPDAEGYTCENCGAPAVCGPYALVGYL